MALILNLETATRICSVVLGRDGTVIRKKESDLPNAHSRVLASFINEILEEEEITPSDLDAVAISKGPGSYTGLRIGVSSAKGMSYGQDIPLVSIPTLMGMAAGARKKYSEDVLFCPMIDARRMEVYTAVYDRDLNEVEKTSAKIIDEHSFADLLKSKTLVFFGDGAEKCRELIQHPNAIFDAELQPSAAWMAELAEQKLRGGEVEDVAYFEPFYLKDFVAGKPKVKGLFD